MLKLNPVNRDGNRYCGPAVISALTRCTTNEASRLIRSVNGKRSVKGTSYGDLIASLSLCGISANLLYKYQTQRPTLAKWLEQTEQLRKPGRVFLICAGNHYQLVSSDGYVCGIVRDVVEVTHSRVKRRARVAVVWELTAQDVAIPAAARAAPAQRTDDRDKRELRKLVKQYGLDFEVTDRSEYCGWVYPPAGFPDDLDPLCDDHYFVGVGEALEKARLLAEALGGGGKK